MVCRKCGWVLPEDAEYCGMCGTKVRKSNAGVIAVALFVVMALGIGSFAAIKINGTRTADTQASSGPMLGGLFGKKDTQVAGADNQPVGEAGSDSDGGLFGLGKKDSKEEEQKLNAFEKKFKNGPVVAYDDNDRAGYIDIHGNWVIQPQFLKAKAFSEGMAAVQDPETQLWGYINESGEYIFRPQYYDACNFVDGSAVVATETYKNYGLMDKNGNFIIQPENRDVSNFKEGYALVRKEYESYVQFYDENGNPAFQPFREANLFDNGIAVVKIDDGYDQWCMLHIDGSYTYFDVVLSEKNAINSHRIYGDSSIGRYVDLSDGFAAKTDNDQYVMIDENGHTISPYFDYLSSFSLDYARAGKKDEHGSLKYGYVNRNYEWVVEPKYWETGYAPGDYAYVVEENAYYEPSYSVDYKWYLVDMNGNKVVDFQEQHNSINMYMMGIYWIYPDEPSMPVPAVKHFSDDPMDVKYGFCDWNYNEVLPFVYDTIEGFPSDRSYAVVKYNGHFGVIDIDGNWLIEPKFTKLSFSFYGM